MMENEPAGSPAAEVVKPDSAGAGAMVGAAGLRASDRDRDAVIEVLQTAVSDGRLTHEELDQRLDVALTARTHSELAALTLDLTGPPAHLPEPKDLVTIECRSSATHRDGRWAVPKRIEAKVRSGTVTLDFTDALIAVPSLRIDAEVRSGSLVLITKPGIVVDTDDVSVRSGVVRVKAPWGDVPPILHVTISGKVGSGTITARPPRQAYRRPRRTFWQWLLRKPKPEPRALPR